MLALPNQLYLNLKWLIWLTRRCQAISVAYVRSQDMSVSGCAGDTTKKNQGKKSKWFVTVTITWLG